MLNSLSLIGTPSGGKSTIGNLLSGRYLLPVGVQETTTRVIELCHDQRIHLPMLTFTDAQKNPIGDMKVLKGDAEIRNQIGNAMSASSSAITHICVQLSMRVKPPTLFQFVCRSRPATPILHRMAVKRGFHIRDFPGFMHADDTRRMRTFEEYFDDLGLLIYTFNAEETDNVKEDRLLSALFAMLRARGRDWRSVTFVLNRKDAFDRDPDPLRSLSAAIASRRARIKRIIAATWDRQSEETPEIIPLAAGPAFACEMLFAHSPSLAIADRQTLQSQVETIAFPLLPPDLQVHLPRSIDRWTDTYWRRVHKSIRHVSGLNAFTNALASQSKSFNLRQGIADLR